MRAIAAAPATDPNAIPILVPVLIPLLATAADEVFAAGAAKDWTEVEDGALVELGAEVVDAGDNEVEARVVELELEEELVVVEESVFEEKPCAEASECSDDEAASSFHITLLPTVAGKDIMFLSMEESEKATVLEESSGHQHGRGVVTVSPSSLHATHWFEVPLQ